MKTDILHALLAQFEADLEWLQATRDWQLDDVLSRTLGALDALR